MRCTNQVKYTTEAMQMLAPIALYVLGSCCINHKNTPWKHLIGTSTVKARNLNRLRTAACCIWISATLQLASRRSRLSTGHRTDNHWVLDLGSILLFGYLVATGKVHSLFAFVILGAQVVISNIYIQKQTSEEEIRILYLKNDALEREIEQANEQLRIAQYQIDDLTQRLGQSGEEISYLRMELLQWDDTDVWG